MNILVSDTIVNDSGFSYRISGAENANKVNQAEPETIKEMGARVAAENTPTFMIDISSQGRVALKTMETLGTKSTFSDFYETVKTDATTVPAKEVVVPEEEENVFEDSDSNFITPLSEEESDGKESETTSEASSNVNLAMYTESQLMSLQRKGVISSAQVLNEIAKRMDAEMTQELEPEEGAKTISGEDLIVSIQMQPVMEQAIAAYNFQMAFSTGQNSLA